MVYLDTNSLLDHSWKKIVKVKFFTKNILYLKKKMKSKEI